MSRDTFVSSPGLKPGTSTKEVLVKILRVLSQRPHPTDMSVVLIEGEATRRLLEDTHEGEGW